jgi:serine/threonine protein phosphatase PrpC
MHIKTTVGQVALMGGGQYQQSSGILVDERGARFGRGRSRGNLYLVLEVSGPVAGRDAIAKQLAQTMRDAYYGWRGSVTAGLQEAVREANNLIFEENRISLPGEQRTAGVSCVVLRDDDMFVAQAGPTAVYLMQGEEVMRIPDVSPWLDHIPPEEMEAVALGERRDINVALFHTTVTQGDIILLVNDGLARLVPDDNWPDILRQRPVESVLEEVLAAGRGSDLSALVVRLEDEVAERAPSRVAPPPAHQEVRPVSAEPLWDRLTTQAADLDVRERLATTGQAVGGAVSGVGAGFVGLLRRMVPELGRSQHVEQRPPAPGPAPKKRPKLKRDRRSHSDTVQKILIVIAIVIPLVVGGVVAVTLMQRGQSQRAELEALWQQAIAQWEQAQAADDLATIRTHLANAEQILQELLARRPEHAEALDLKGRVQARLDVINQVRRVNWIGPLNTYAADAELSRVVVQGTHIFVMDRRNGRVYHHQLDEELQRALRPETEDTVLLSKGDQIGGVLVGDLVDMVWMPTGPDRQKASLVILESGGNLLDYDPATDELVPLRVAATDSWRFADLVGSHTGRFYVLDPSANQIWRYDPTADGYFTPPDEWLQEPVDLVGVVDMAIGDSIFLLYADGSIRKLTQGKPDVFDTSDWDAPPRNPSALFTRPPDDTQWLYVADRGSSRIVQSGKEGRFKQQFRLADSAAAESGDPLAGVTSLFVDEIAGHAFVISGQKLYLLVLPISD